MTHIIIDSRISVSSRDGFFKIFSAFPTMYSIYIPNDTDMVAPLQTNISARARSIIAEKGLFTVLRSFGGKAEFSTRKGEMRKLKVREWQYSALTDDKICEELTLNLLLSNLNSKMVVVSRIEKKNPDLSELRAELENFQISEVEDERWKTFLFTQEAAFSGTYFEVFGRYCEHLGWEFGARSRRPAENPVNALLNYGYAVLKGTIDDLIMASGLDPYVGFLHTLRPGRESLSFDLIEPFRAPIVDMSVLEILENSLLGQEDFEMRKDEVRLSPKAKEVLLKLIKLRTFIGVADSEALIVNMDHLVQEFIQFISKCTS